MKANTNNRPPGRTARDIELLSGLIYIYILHRASDVPVSDLEIHEGLKEGGHMLSRRRVAAVLNHLEMKGYLRSEHAKTNHSGYQATARGKKLFLAAAEKLQNLWNSLSQS